MKFLKIINPQSIYGHSNFQDIDQYKFLNLKNPFKFIHKENNILLFKDKQLNIIFSNLLL
jgi:hypothetical protein